VLQTLEEEDIITRAAEMGAYLTEKLTGLQQSHGVIEEIRGRGLLIGVRLSVPGAPVVADCMQKGYLVNCVQDNVLRLAPPLIVSREEIDGLIDCLDRVFYEWQFKDKESSNRE
jgi:acetylornithine/N-succinyldiaminopimelate aminotransferase